MPAEDNLRQYFHTLWRDTEGVVYLPSRGANPKDWKQTLFTWPRDEDRIVQMVQARTGDREVFVNPTIYRDDGTRDKDTIARANVLGSWTLWADFDGTVPDPWPTDIPMPSMRIQTSTRDHQHAYWVLDEFLTDPTVIEDKNRALAHQLKADVSGWDISQLLRPPNTINHKYGKEEHRGRKYDVLVEETSDRTYPPTFVQRESVYRPVVQSDLALADLPSIRTVLAEGLWSTEFLNLFEKVSPADRSSALMAVGYFAAEAGFNDAAIYTVVEDADSRWGKYKDRKDRERRLIDIVDRARRKYPFSGGPSEDFTELSLEISPQTVFSFADFMAAEVEVRWQFENLFPQSGYGIFYGMPGVGKTLIGMDFANRIVLGQDWLVWKNVMGPQSVLFLSLEMNHPTLKMQYQKMTATYSQEQIDGLNERLFVAPLAETIPLDTREGRAKLESFLLKYRPNVLYIDSLSESSYRSLLDDGGVRDLNRFVRYIREKYTCSVYIVHHDRKSSANSTHQDLDSMWGSRFISSAADFILFLENTTPVTDQIWLHHDKNRLGTTEEKFLIDRNWEDFTFLHAGMTQDTATERIRDALVHKRSIGGSSYRPDSTGGDNIFGDIY